MATLNFGIATTNVNTGAAGYRTKWIRHNPTTIVCIGTGPVGPLSWDPEGILGQPNTGHLARLEFKRRMEKDSDAREAFERQVREEKERRQALRQSRDVPDTPQDLIEYLLDTEAQEIEFEIARMRPRLNKEFFSELKSELGQLRFAVNKTPLMDDRLTELEALEKAIQEGIDAYDKMQNELTKAKESLTKILTSKDVKATLLEMVETNEINRSLLTLLDENIATAHEAKQKQAAEYMEKLRGAVLKYITV
ncbi:dimethylallyl, adenosine tRNA methylthiotransferase [Trifolium repens]|nr:dimethylallyl, adenosine tRNA methylthiotransferase [Trifolium repens]